MTTSPEPGPIKVNTTRPPGVMPKHLQAYVVGGLALAMVVVIAFSGRSPSRAPETTTAPRALDAVDPNQTRIEEYRRRLEEDARRLAQDQARAAQNGRIGGPAAQGAESGAVATYGIPGTMPPATPERSWIDLDREKREYASRYASNVALSKRDARAQPAAIPRSTTPATTTTGPNGPATAALTYRLPAGTVIETVLTNRLDSTFSGPVKALVTTDVYSLDHAKLLVPKGTFAIGSVAKTESFGEERLAVSFSSLEFPNGRAAALETLPGLSQVGETGLLDQVNRHYGRIFGVSLAIGAIAGLSQANTGYGSNASTADVYRQGVATSLSQSSLHVLDRFLNVVPTFTVREGTRIKVFLTGSLELPPYDSVVPPSPRRPS
jgi:type IV secretion system protein VirB10